MKVLFLQSNIDDAHQLRLRRQLVRSGHEVVACGFRRPYYRGKPVEGRPISLGHLGHSSVVARVPTLLSAIQRVRRLSIGCSAIFVFGSDMHALGYIATIGRAGLAIREVADIPKLLSGAGWKGRLARSLERWSLRRLDTLIVTSEAFLSEYYYPTFGDRSVPRAFVLENKVDTKLDGPRLPASKLVESRPVRIGYFGLLRCARSIEVLIALAARFPDRFSVQMRGYNFIDYPIQDRCSGLQNVAYTREFRNPEDLRAAYNSCDVVWSCYPYDPSNVNARMARTNRFYEACYFRRPQICQTGTIDAVKVTAYGIGVAVDLESVDQAVQQVSTIARSDWRSMASRIELLPESEYCYQDELTVVMNELRARRA